MAHQSHMKTVLTTAIAIAEQNNGEFSADAVSNSMMAQTRKHHKTILNTLGELCRLGKLQRLRQGVYAPVVLPKKISKREAMWRVLRMRKRVTIEDMMTMVGVGKRYAYEWLATLVAQGVARKIQGPEKKVFWLLINDRVKMPEDGTKAAKLRDIRARKKAESCLITYGATRKG